MKISLIVLRDMYSLCRDHIRARIWQDTSDRLTLEQSHHRLYLLFQPCLVQTLFKHVYTYYFLLQSTKARSYNDLQKNKIPRLVLGITEWDICICLHILYIQSRLQVFFALFFDNALLYKFLVVFSKLEHWRTSSKYSCLPFVD